MRILILVDEPIIAFDLEDIVSDANGADCTLAQTVRDGLRSVEQGIDFAILDVHLGYRGATSYPVAQRLQERGIPFCFVSCGRKPLPPRFGAVPLVSKPFHPSAICGMLPMAA
jgi:DNA-binding response OmpR family regulator